MATFRGLSIDKAGASYTLTASSGPAHGPVTSSAFDVTPAAQAITFPPLAGVRLDQTAPATLASASSDLPVTYSSLTSTTCSVMSDGVITLLHAGDYTIAADQFGDGTYAAADRLTKTFTIARGNQTTLAITAPVIATFAAPDATIATSGGSGLGALSYDSGSSTACSMVAGKLHVISVARTCAITASKAADADYNVATSAAFDVTIAKADQAITFGALAARTLAESPVTIGAAASSGLAVGFSSNSLLVCTVTGTSVTLLTVGTCSITAAHTGDGNWNAASSVIQTFGVSMRPVAPIAPPAAPRPTITAAVVASVAPSPSSDPSPSVAPSPAAMPVATLAVMVDVAGSVRPMDLTGGIVGLTGLAVLATLAALAALAAIWFVVARPRRRRSG